MCEAWAEIIILFKVCFVLLQKLSADFFYFFFIGVFVFLWTFHLEKLFFNKIGFNVIDK